MVVHQEVPQGLKHPPSLHPASSAVTPRAAMQCKRGLCWDYSQQRCATTPGGGRNTFTDELSAEMPMLTATCRARALLSPTSSLPPWLTPMFIKIVHTCFPLHVPTGCIDTVHSQIYIFFHACRDFLTHTQTQWKQWAAIKQFSPSQLPHQANKGSHSLPQMVDDVPCC